jgi:hypothetical protein
MIVTIHVATGAAGGALTRSRPAAVALGPVLHLLCDLIPHRDIESRRFEIRSGLACALALALRHGPLSPVTLGALASSAPDLEHVLRLPQPGGRKLFPSHRIGGLHRAGGVPTWAQLLAAGAILGAVLVARR